MIYVKILLMLFFAVTVTIVMVLDGVGYFPRIGNSLKKQMPDVKENDERRNLTEARST